MSPGPVRTLVVHTGGIGDLLLCAPSVQALQGEGPVELAGIPGRLALLVAGGAAEQAHHLDSTGFASAFTKPSGELRRFLARFGRTIVWMTGDDGSLQAALRSCGPGDVRVFPGLPPPDWRRHASLYYLEKLGFSAAPPFLLGQAGPAIEHDVVIHPGSGGRAKNWPFERFEALARRLESSGRRISWCMGPAEEERGLACEGEVLRRERLTELAADLRGARLYIGNDSGITHLAAACGCPALAVFGPTNPAVWVPLGPHVSVVQGTPWPSEEAVAAAL